MQAFMQDLRFAVRVLSKNPGFTALAVFIMALGIGPNTAVFTMINAVLVQTLPVPNPEQLVLLTSYERNGHVGNFAYPDYERLRDGSEVFSAVLAASRPASISIELDSDTERALAQIVSSNYFSVLGVRAIFGRTLTEEDNDSRVAVISHRFWQRIFGGDPNVLVKPLILNGSTCRIVGVAPPEFFGETLGQATDIWVSMGMWHDVRPISDDLRNVRYVTWLYLMGRLKPGATIEQARAEAEVLVPRIHAEFNTDPEKDYLHHIAMESGSRGSAGLRDRFSPVLVVLTALVFFVLFIACTNLASLVLARAIHRQREIASRLALGATRARVIRQFLTESLLLAVLGSALGLLLAVWMNSFLVRMVSEGIGSITIDLDPGGLVLLFSVAVAVLTGVTSGLAPAIRATRIDVSPMLKMHSRPLARGGSRWGVYSAIITAQVALSLVLLVGGLLFARTLWKLKTVDTGFQPENVLLVGIGPHDQQQERALAGRLLERLSAIPGVQFASLSFNTPLGNATSGVHGLEVPGYTPQSEQDQRARADWVGPDYFKALGIPLLKGREFSLSDTINSPGVAIVNQAMARYYFGDRAPLGQHLRFNGREYEIIGVAADAKYSDFREPTPRMLYFSFLQNPAGLNTIEIRTAGMPLELVGAVRQAIRDVDPRLNVRDITTLSGLIDRKLAPEYLVAGMSVFFSGLTLMLACIGIYGTLAATVAGRTNEIGIRMAVGARSISVLLLILKDLVRPLSAGLVIGGLIVLATGRVVASLLFGLGPRDPATIAFAVLLIILVALLAGYIPAHRASRVDPVAALRFE